MLDYKKMIDTWFAGIRRCRQIDRNLLAEQASERHLHCYFTSQLGQCQAIAGGLVDCGFIVFLGLNLSSLLSSLPHRKPQRLLAGT